MLANMPALSHLTGRRHLLENEWLQTGKRTTLPRNPLHFLIMSPVCGLNAVSGSLGNPAISQYVNFSGLTHFERNFVGRRVDIIINNLKFSRESVVL